MPYIKQAVREEFQEAGKSGHNPMTETPGELNYELTLKCLKYLEVNGLDYQTINDVVGALEGCKLEFYRRVAVPYENKKIEENGDVYFGPANAERETLTIEAVES